MSKMRDPSPRCMNRGSPPTERNARTALFTPPGIFLTARSIASIVLASTLPPRFCKRAKPPSKRLVGVYIVWSVRVVREVTLGGEPAGYVRGVVGDDDVGAGAFHASERLED